MFKNYPGLSLEMGTMRKLLVCCFVVLFPGVLSATKRPTDHSEMARIVRE